MWILDHKDVANKQWFKEQLESLIGAIDSPENLKNLKTQETRQAKA